MHTKIYLGLVVKSFKMWTFLLIFGTAIFYAYGEDIKKTPSRYVTEGYLLSDSTKKNIFP
jgi:hypothetical protein